MIGGNPAAAMMAVETASSNPTLTIFALLIGACVILTPPCIMCSCAAFIFKSLWLPEDENIDPFIVSRNEDSENNKYN